MWPLLRTSGLLLVYCAIVCKGEIQFATAIDISDLGERIVRKDLLPPCQACKTVVKTFLHGVERTSRSRFDGGDVDWERKKMGKYKTSEIRFIEIQEHLCHEVVKGQEHCRNTAEQYEEHLEEWWFGQQEKEPDLHKYLCIEKAKACCPENHYGPNCEPCTGGAEKPCGGHGKCKGAGTRKGSGKCTCDAGYSGEVCETCVVGYFDDQNDKGEKVCTKCHQACKGPCKEPGPKACEACNEGFIMTEEFGCLDVDECVESETPLCGKNTFCVNNEGSYKCVECDYACNGCTGDGPDMCEHCAEGYVLKDKVCVDVKKEEDEPEGDTEGEQDESNPKDQSVKWRELHVLLARYATYLGLCVATFIIFKRNVYTASVIGVFVAVYIGFSEYTLTNWKEHSVTTTFKNALSW